MAAWSRCWASARIWALPARCSRSPPSPLRRRLRGWRSKVWKKLRCAASEIMQFGDAIEAEVGSTAVMGRLGGASPSTATAMLPFATVEWRHGASTVRYRMATMMQDHGVGEDESETAVWLPAMAERNGALAIEHGIHQEIGWERRDRRFGHGRSGLLRSHRQSRTRGAGPLCRGRFCSAAAGCSSIRRAICFAPLGRPSPPRACEASVEHRLAGGNRIRVSYASGGALVMPALPQATPLTEVLASARPRHAQTYAISLSGTLDGTRTRWRASYRWQPDDTVTELRPSRRTRPRPSSTSG